MARSAAPRWILRDALQWTPPREMGKSMTIRTLTTLSPAQLRRIATVWLRPGRLATIAVAAAIGWATGHAMLDPTPAAAETAPAIQVKRAGDRQLVEFCAILAVLVWLRHHANLRRLVKGEEAKITLRKS